MKMYQIIKEGTSLFLKPEELKDTVLSDYLEKDESYELKMIDMDEDKVKDLPEFECFD